MSKLYKIDDILKKLNHKFKIFGKNLIFRNFSSFYEIEKNSCTFLESLDDNSMKRLKEIKNVIILTNDKPSVNISSNTYVVVNDPRKIFFQIIDNFHLTKTTNKAFIHPTALISKNSKIGDNVFIGEYCIIGDSEICENTSIASYTKIHDNVFIGKNVHIHEFCNIGSNGFGHVWSEDHYVNQPHIGKVYIEDDVEIFPYTNVDRGCLGSTKIGKGTKIDHFCHIGHNTKIKKHNLIMANTTTCGETIIGSQNVLGAGTMIRDKTKIGDKNFFGMRSSVFKDVNNDEIWHGSPAKYIKKNK